MPSNIVNTYSGDYLTPVFPDEAQAMSIELAGGVNLPKGQVLGQIPGTGSNVSEVQTLTITGTPTGGTFRLAFNGQVTTPLNHNSNAAAVQAALQALSTIGNGGATCTGGPLPGTAVVITFAGDLASRAQNLITVFSTAFTGGTSPAAAVARTTPGKPANGYWDAYNDAASDGRETAKLILQYPTQTDAKGSHSWGGGEHEEMKWSCPAYYCGSFYGKDLVGLDANAVADLQARFLSGSISTLADPKTILRVA